MSSVKPFTFNAVDLCFVNINPKPWARATDVYRELGFSQKHKNAKVIRHRCSSKNVGHKH